jgi:hypothetical protein
MLILNRQQDGAILVLAEKRGLCRPWWRLEKSLTRAILTVCPYADTPSPPQLNGWQTCDAAAGDVADKRINGGMPAGGSEGRNIITATESPRTAADGKLSVPRGVLVKTRAIARCLHRAPARVRSVALAGGA